MQTQTPPRDAIFSADGYAVEQTRAAHLAYGRFGSHYNGCGWMAAYNMLHALGFCPNADTIRTDLARGLLFGGKLGTGPLRLARYLRAQGVPVRLTLGRSAAFRRAQSCRAGAVLYGTTGRVGAHYVAFAPVPEAAPACGAQKKGGLARVAAQSGVQAPAEIAQLPADGTQDVSTLRSAPLAQSLVAAQSAPVVQDTPTAQSTPTAQGAPNATVTQSAHTPRALRFFNVGACIPVLVQTLPDFCAGACAHTPALFLFVE